MTIRVTAMFEFEMVEFSSSDLLPIIIVEKKKRKKGKRVFKQALQYSCDNETDIGYRNKIMTIILESNWINTDEEDELTGFVN